MSKKRNGKIIIEDLYLDDDTSIEDYVAANGGGIPDYSTDEQDTGAVWVDGTTPIYQKTINVGDLTGGSSKDVAHGITGLARVVGIEGGMEDGQAGASQVFYPLPFASPSANISVQIQLTATQIKVFAGSYWNRAGGGTELNSAYVTVRYLKS
jgi:hypothetical protein